MLFVTNNASKSRRSYVSRFSGLGLEGVSEKEVISSSYAAAAYLHSLGFKKKVFLIGNIGLEEELRLHHIPFVGGESSPSVTPFMGDTEAMLNLKASVSQCMGYRMTLNPHRFRHDKNSIEFVCVRFIIKVDPDIGAVVVGWDPRFDYSKLVYASICLRFVMLIL